MHTTSRYTVFIFFGVLLALVGMFALAGWFVPTGSPKSSPKATNAVGERAQIGQQQATTSAANPVNGIDPTTVKPLAAVKQDVHTITGVPVDQIGIITIQQVNWPTGALGCPHPGTTYTQAVVPGYAITLSVPGEQFEYHTSLDNQIQLCKDTRGD